tara:strand:- start:5382 stop:6407 length:1026 start_codon:yes stop_codon:yes gene_type:complete
MKSELIFFGTDLHQKPTELASKTVSNLAPNFQDSIVLSIQNRKRSEKRQNLKVIPSLTKIRHIRTLFQAIILPFYFINLKSKGYNKIATFWTVNNQYHSLLFKFLKLLKFKIYFTIISGYDKNYGALQNVDTIICQTPKMLSLMREKFPNKNTSLIYPGVDLNLFKPKRKLKRMLIPSVPYLVSLFHERRINNTIEFLEENKEIKATIITRSNQSSSYIKSKLSETEIINQSLSDEELSQKMSGASVIPLLYKDSPDIPLSAVEGLASGAAIICSDAMGLSDIIEQNNCGIVYPKNKQDIDKKDVEKLLNSPKFQKDARETALKLFSLDKMIKKYVTLLSA